MHCSNCKAKVNPGDEKCLNCGATLIWNNKKKQPLKTKNTKEKVKDKKEGIDKYVHEKMIKERKEKELKKIKERHTVFTKLILIFEFSLFLFSLFFLIIGLKVFLGVFLMGSFLFFLILTLISLFSKHLRPTFWLPIIFIFCIMSLTIFITVVNIPFANKALKETGAEEIFEEVLPAEEPVEEKVIEEHDEEFSFDEYIEKSKVREYKIIEEEDISLKALGDKSLSDYNSEELDKLPKNYRMKYSITIPRDITEDELKSTLSQIIKEKSINNLEIDEIVVFAWYFEESVGQTTAMGSAEWCPNGEWGGLSPEIAENNIRNSYKIIFSINIQEEEEKYGLTEAERKQAFYDLVELQDSVPLDDPEWDEKQEEAYVIIAEKYGITRDQMFQLGVEGVTKGWPMPDLPADEENLTNEVEPEQTNVAAELANALISNNYDIRYIDYSEDEHPYQGYYNYVQLGIKDENIPTAGNWGGPSWEEVQNIIEVIKKYYPDSEVWIICFFNNSNGQYAVETHSIPELNIGGGSKGTEPPTWVCNGINPIWGAD